MGNTQSVRDVQRLVDEKGAEHGDSWRVVSVLFDAAVQTGPLDPLLRSEFFSLWFMIIFKLARLMYKPDSVDSWQDIQGYAELALREIEKNDAT